MNLPEIRREIDDLDSRIIELLSKRSALVSEAGKLKKTEAEVRASDRIAEVIQKVRKEAAKTGMDPLIAERIYRTITDCFINKEMGEFIKSEGPTVRIYRREDLPLKPAVPGAKMWAVGLEKSMLTYFEMAPDTIFPDHSHEAEQITLVLEGTLTFTYEGKKAVLKPGEVIAIPSDVRHAVATGDRPCKAVDAWSSVRKEFL